MARQVALRVLSGSPVVTGSRLHKREYIPKKLFSIEVCTETNNKLALALGHVGPVLKVCLPRRNVYAGKERRRKLCTHAPPPPPKLPQKGCVTWRLDLRVASHQDALRRYIATCHIPKGTQLAYQHFSPPCTWVQPGIRVNIAKGADLEQTCEDGAALLSFCRELAKIWIRRGAQEDIQFVASAEQTSRSSTAPALRLLPQKKRKRITIGYPWMLHHRGPRVSVCGGALGLADQISRTYVNKRWTLEATSATLLRLLRRYRAAPPGSCATERFCFGDVAFAATSWFPRSCATRRSACGPPTT